MTGTLPDIDLIFVREILIGYATKKEITLQMFVTQMKEQILKEMTVSSTSTVHKAHQKAGEKKFAKTNE